MADSETPKRRGVLHEISIWLGVAGIVAGAAWWTSAMRTTLFVQVESLNKLSSEVQALNNTIRDSNLLYRVTQAEKRLDALERPRGR